MDLKNGNVLGAKRKPSPSKELLITVFVSLSLNFADYAKSHIKG